MDVFKLKIGMMVQIQDYRCKQHLMYKVLVFVVGVIMAVMEQLMHGFVALVAVLVKLDVNMIMGVFL